MQTVDLEIYFNFRSPYCYLASKRMFTLLDNFHVNLVWRPLGGWNGRSPPERAKRKLPLSRQDVGRFARKMGIPFNPPPKTTDPTPAGALSLLAQEKGLLRPYVIEVMRTEWAEGQDIGDLNILMAVAERVGLDRSAANEAVVNPAYQAILESNWQQAEERGVFGVPTFIVGQEIFWGQDRIDFVREQLTELRLARR